MNKKEQIDELKQYILDTKRNLAQAERQVQYLEKEASFEFPKMFQSYFCWASYLKDSVKGNYKGVDLLSLLSSKKTYAEFQLKYIAKELNHGWKADYKCDGQPAYYIFFDNDMVEFRVDSAYVKVASTVYFRSPSIAYRAIELMGSGIQYLKGKE